MMQGMMWLCSHRKLAPYSGLHGVLSCHSKSQYPTTLSKMASTTLGITLRNSILYILWTAYYVLWYFPLYDLTKGKKKCTNNQEKRSCLHSRQIQKHIYRESFLQKQRYCALWRIKYLTCIMEKEMKMSTVKTKKECSFCNSLESGY